MTEAQFSKEYKEAVKERRIWQKDDKEFERLANNELLADLDPNLPETNDGSLAASLFKLPKRVVPNDLSGSPRALDRSDKWINEFAKIEWEKNIIPNANTQAPFNNKWKDAVRKAAIYGSVPLITITTELPDGSTSSDFIVAYPADCTLEPGKVSDTDSDIIYWDVYFSDSQLDNLIEQHKKESKEAKAEGREAYNTWNLEALKELRKSKETDERDSQDMPSDMQGKDVIKGGKKVVMRFKRGVNEPVIGYAPAIKKFIREYPNPDPTGDIQVHYLYCYQDFINPYGIGICKLAGGTQNVLDFMRQSDVLATQVGIRPPTLVSGDVSKTDFDSFVYAQDAIWIAGNAQVVRQNLANGIYNELPNRISMYKTSLNQLIPTGDTSISASAGDPNYSKTPAGVKFQQSSLSIDDDDMSEKLFIAYSAVGRSMINVHFANKQGTDMMKLSDAEKDRIFKSAPDLFPQLADQIDPETEEVIPASDELEVIWDNARANYDFQVDPEPKKSADEEQQLNGLLKVLELVQADTNFEQEMAMAGKKFNKGELLSDIIQLTTDNEKIITDMSSDEQSEVQTTADAQVMESDQSKQDEMPIDNQEPPVEQSDPVDQIMATYGVDEEQAVMLIQLKQKGYDLDQLVNEMRAANA